MDFDNNGIDKANIGDLSLNLESRIMLHAFSGTTYDTLQDENLAGYEVPVGKTLQIEAVIFECDTSNGGLKIGYGDNNVASSGVAPTNAVYYTSSNIMNCLANTKRQTPVKFNVPAGKFPFFLPSANGVCTVIGKLIS